jgi:MHS family proline/betaine transporter-like MFS transporter
MFSSLKSYKKISFISFLGTSLEFYDFTLFGIFAGSIASHFFPANNEIISLLAAFGAFAAGFIMRPLGGLLFGYIGDTYGRRRALSLSILLMGIPTLITALLPSYQTIGFIAPLVIVLSRLLQGLSTGGEFNGAAIFALEHVKENHPGFVGSLLAVAGGVGAIFAMLLGALVSTSSFPEYGFRIPFFLGALISLLGFYLRRKLEESPEFLEIKSEKKPSIPLIKIIKDYLPQFGSGFSIGALDGATAYLLVGFMNVYLSKFIGMEVSHAMLLNSFSLAIYIIFTPIMGYLFDKTKSHTFIKIMCLSVIFLAPVIFLGVQSKDFRLILIAQAMFALIFSAVSGCQHAYLQNLFPTNIRYTGISFSFNLGTAILGGTAPVIVTYLYDVTKNLMIPAYFLMGLGLMTLLFNLKKKNK